jgi:hypothetical protein
MNQSDMEYLNGVAEDLAKEAQSYVEPGTDPVDYWDDVSSDLIRDHEESFSSHDPSYKPLSQEEKDYLREKVAEILEGGQARPGQPSPVPARSRLNEVKDAIYDATKAGADPSKAAVLPGLFREYERLTGKKHPLGGTYASWVRRNCKFAQALGSAPENEDWEAKMMASGWDERLEKETWVDNWIKQHPHKDPERDREEAYRAYRDYADKGFLEKQRRPDPRERMYDLHKKGPDMTPEEDAEMRGLIGRHGRPKFMAREKVMTKQEMDAWVRRNCKFAAPDTKIPAQQAQQALYILRAAADQMPTNENLHEHLESMFHGFRYLAQSKDPDQINSMIMKLKNLIAMAYPLFTNRDPKVQQAMATINTSLIEIQGAAEYS